MVIYGTQHIFNKLDWCIKYKKPFSHIRFGDGGIKFIHCVLNKDLDDLRIIMKKEGLPANKILEVFELWGYYARRADFIDTPEVYYNNTFWPRLKKGGRAINKPTDIKMRLWKDLYYSAEIINDSYCNPESNCLFILDIPNRRNIFDLLKDRKICIICAKPEVKHALYKYNVDIIKIVGQWQNHYKNSFEDVINKIRESAKDYDLWLVAAGELGRIYTGLIKECGGRSLDMGFVIDYWTDGYLHPRFYKFISTSLSNRLELRLTKEGKKYLEYI
ncbi:MAG: hypothetical protein ACFFG0_01240 [Candidatus Thorarchaeota archaeon]